MDLVRKGYSCMNESVKIFQIEKAWSLLRTVQNKSCELNVKPRMIRCCSLLLLLCFPLISYCQIGVNVRYLFGQSDILEQEEISQNGVHAAAEYHFRLKNKRLEFHPGLGYRFTFNSDAYQGYLTGFDLDLATAIYPFDFGGDCDCPTFSKQGNLIKKGFFFELIPGLSYQTLTRLRSEPDDPQNLPIRSKNLNWKLGGAAGLDIGISEHYTLTPMFSVTMLSASEWDGLKKDGTSGRLDDYMYLGAGLRVIYSSGDKRRRRF